MDLSNKKLKNLLISLLKFAVSAGMLYLLASKIGVETIIGYLKLLNPLAFICAAGLYIFSIYISSLRWSLLINQKISKKRLFSIYMIGSFFNICLPGIIGGDAMKAYYLSRELKDASIIPLEKNKSNWNNHEGNITAIASVFMDRYIGFLALLTIGIAAFPFGFKYIDRTPDGDFFIWLIPIVSLLFVFMSFVILRFRIGAGIGFFLKIYGYFDLYIMKKNALIKAFMYSMVIQMIGILSVYILSRGMSFEIPLLPLLIFIPVIIVISLIPISISGIGVREFAFVLFLGSAGVPSDISAALSISWFLSIALASLWGFLEYLRFNADPK